MSSGWKSYRRRMMLPCLVDRPSEKSLREPGAVIDPSKLARSRTSKGFLLIMAIGSLFPPNHRHHARQSSGENERRCQREHNKNNVWNPTVGAGGNGCCTVGDPIQFLLNRFHSRCIEKARRYDGAYEHKKHHRTNTELGFLTSQASYPSKG